MNCRDRGHTLHRQESSLPLSRTPRWIIPSFRFISASAPFSCIDEISRPSAPRQLANHSGFHDSVDTSIAPFVSSESNARKKPVMIYKTFKLVIPTHVPETCSSCLSVAVRRSDPVKVSSKVSGSWSATRKLASFYCNIPDCPSAIKPKIPTN
jgi:hypothetical protein